MKARKNPEALALPTHTYNNEYNTRQIAGDVAHLRIIDDISIDIADINELLNAALDAGMFESISTEEPTSNRSKFSYHQGRSTTPSKVKKNHTLQRTKVELTLPLTPAI